MKTQSKSKPIQLKGIAELSLKEQVADLRILVRNLTRRIELLESHVHTINGLTVVPISQVHLP